jgi:hypothetical protein
VSQKMANEQNVETACTVDVVIEFFMGFAMLFQNMNTHKDLP